MTPEPTLTSPPLGAAAARQQLLRLVLGTEHCAVRVDAVREILQLSPMTPLPLMPPFVRGVMNLRGAVVPVLDLGARLGLGPATLGRRACVVVVDAPSLDPNTPAPALGLLVDGVLEVFDSTETESVPRLGTRFEAQHLSGIHRVRGSATPELNLATVLDPAALSQDIADHAQALG